VTADACVETSVAGTALDHPEHVDAVHGAFRQFAGAAAG
jgi:hypothetical protein